MEIGIGVDPGARLTFPQHREMIREAARLGYTSAWTPAGIGQDAFQTCAQWWQASADEAPGGLTTGISVVPVPIWSAPALATAAGTLGELTGGRFILGVGSGSIHSEEYRRSLGLPNYPPVAMMRDYLVTLRGLLAGGSVEDQGRAVTPCGRPPGTQPPPAPPHLRGPGPRMAPP